MLGRGRTEGMGLSEGERGRETGEGREGKERGGGKEEE